MIKIRHANLTWLNYCRHSKPSISHGTSASLADIRWNSVGTANDTQNNCKVIGQVDLTGDYLLRKSKCPTWGATEWPKISPLLALKSATPVSSQLLSIPRTSSMPSIDGRSDVLAEKLDILRSTISLFCVQWNGLVEKQAFEPTTVNKYWEWIFKTYRGAFNDLRNRVLMYIASLSSNDCFQHMWMSHWAAWEALFYAENPMHSPKCRFSSAKFSSHHASSLGFAVVRIVLSCFYMHHRPVNWF